VNTHNTAANLPPVIQPRQKIRLLTAFITIGGTFIVAWVYGYLRRLDPQSRGLLLLIAAGVVGYLYRGLWFGATAQKDRSILLFGISLIAFLPLYILALFAPEEYGLLRLIWALTFTFLLVPGCYSVLEYKWGKTGGIIPLQPGHSWPTVEDWLSNFASLPCKGSLILLLIATALIKKEVSNRLPLVVFILLITAVITTYRWSVNSLKRQIQTAKTEAASALFSATGAMPNANAFPRGPMYCFLTLAIINYVIHQFWTHDWVNDYDWPTALLNIVVSGVLISGVLYSLHHLWLRPSPKTDRLVMFASFGAPLFLGMLIVGSFIPEDWEEESSWGLLLLIAFIDAKLVRHYEHKWVREGKIPAMPGNQSWPALKSWFPFMCIWFFFCDLSQRLILNGNENIDSFADFFWGLFLPFLFTKALFYIFDKWRPLQKEAKAVELSR